MAGPLTMRMVANSDNATCLLLLLCTSTLPSASRSERKSRW